MVFKRTERLPLFMARSSLPVPLLCLLFVLLGASPAFARDFWNIDCGGNETFANGNHLTFEGDARYIRTGVSREVRGAASNGIPQEISTLRAFPAAPWKKSCYRIPVEPETKVLVRTKFYYGNYDGLNSPPAFEVRYDTAELCSVTLDSDLSSWSYCEVVYLTTKKQGTDICFVRTESDQTPIVSTIEVRRLPRNMYEHLDFSSHALFMEGRFAFGANNTISYPHDVYNREWEANDLQGVEGGVNKPVIVNMKMATAMNSEGIENSPPALLFEAAAVAEPAANLTIRATWLPSDTVEIYITMYFTEPVPSNGTSAQEKRVFSVYMDGNLLHDGNDIELSYGIASYYWAYRYNASNETAFDLAPANGSTLPPAISGMETFSINQIDNATKSNDVEALSMIQSSFKVLQDWTGDPCFPKNYNWEWVGCNYPSASPPRVTKLLLSGYQLSGLVPDFSALDALEDIYLSNNSFTGSVPEFLASLPNLKTLDLSDNDFDSIPESLLNYNGINLTIKGNPKLNRAVASPVTPPQAAPSASPKVCCPQSVHLVLLLATAAMVW